MRTISRLLDFARGVALYLAKAFSGLQPWQRSLFYSQVHRRTYCIVLNGGMLLPRASTHAAELLLESCTVQCLWNSQWWRHAWAPGPGLESFAKDLSIAGLKALSLIMACSGLPTWLGAGFLTLASFGFLYVTAFTNLSLVKTCSGVWLSLGHVLWPLPGSVHSIPIHFKTYKLFSAQWMKACTGFPLLHGRIFSLSSLCRSWISIQDMWLMEACSGARYSLDL